MNKDTRLEHLLPPKFIKMVFPLKRGFPGDGPAWADFNKEVFSSEDYVLFAEADERVETSLGIYEKDIKGSLIKFENSSDVHRFLRVLKYRKVSG